MAGERTKVGVVGCGNISGVYIKRSKIFSAFEIVACADAIMERAKAKAAEFSIPKVCTVEELLADPEIGIVLNLTIPKAHGEIGLAALKAGKSVYNEKPLAVTREEAKKMADLAKSKKLRIGCAPDTFLGAGFQTCRKLIADGWIGTPVAATAFMLGHGPENWHPDPETFYQPGAGPMFDMGPYYLTALVNLIGPVKKVTSCAKITFPERTIGSQPKAGARFKVNSPTHVVGIMEFAGGAVGSIITSFDVWASNLPCIEIYGTAGTLSCPDPNTFGGPVRLRRAGANEWREMPLSHGYAEQSRGVGLADMAVGIRNGRPHRANGSLAYHVLDIMQSFLDASAKGRSLEMGSTCEQPAPLPLGLADGSVDE
jgi:predicted dehydrogenase